MKALLVLALVACDNHGSTPDWSRMITQPKALPYGAAMRALPKGTIARERPHRGSLSAAMAALRTARSWRRYRCRSRARCSSAAAIASTSSARPATGSPATARVPSHTTWERRRPLSLHELRLVALSPGAMYRVIVDG